MSKEKQETSSQVGGVPTSYTLEIGDRICSELAEGTSVRRICEQPWAPARRTIYTWLRQQPEFLAQYRQAQLDGAHAWADKAIEAAEDGRNDWMANNDPDNPGYRFNGEHFGRSRLRVDTYKWAAARMNPKAYGDKVAIGGAEDLPPLQTADVSQDELARRIAFALAAGINQQQTTH